MRLQGTLASDAYRVDQDECTRALPGAPGAPAVCAVWSRVVVCGAALARRAPMKPVSLSTFLALAGCTVMVNGKPRRIGGSDPTPTAQAPTQAPAAAPTR